jgi:Sporulation and spore germination
MNSIKKCLLSLPIGIILISGVGSGWLAATDRDRSLSVAASPVAASPVAASSVTPASPVQIAQPVSEKTVPITIYEADAQCETFVPLQVEVSRTNSLNGAIGAVLDRWNSGDFSLAGYQVSVDEANQIATIDLRVDPTSERQLISLSTCERFALFGSLSQTLTQNPQWQISRVQFTEKGDPIGY